MYRLEKMQNNVILYDGEDAEKKIDGYNKIKKAALDIPQDFIIIGHIYKNHFLVRDLIYFNDMLENEKTRSNFLHMLADQLNWYDKKETICLTSAFIMCKKCNQFPPCNCERLGKINFDIPIEYLEENARFEIASYCNKFDDVIVDDLLATGSNRIRKKIYELVDRQTILNRGVKLLKDNNESLDVVTGILQNSRTPKTALASFWRSLMDCIINTHKEKLNNNEVDLSLNDEFQKYILGIIAHIHCDIDLLMNVYNFLSNRSLITKEIVVALMQQNISVDLKNSILQNDMKDFDINELIFEIKNEKDKKNKKNIN
jgi:hypothetical protein